MAWLAELSTIQATGEPKQEGHRGGALHFLIKIIGLAFLKMKLFAGLANTEQGECANDCRLKVYKN